MSKIKKVTVMYSRQENEDNIGPEAPYDRSDERINELQKKLNEVIEELNKLKPVA